MKTSPSAIARIIKRDVGYQTVPWGWQGVTVTAGARSGTAYVECNFELEAIARRRMTRIAEVLAEKGYTVIVTPDGAHAHVG